ncbi:MAG: glycosyltransferase family 4 protein [Aggregatilineales bacterium]
MKICMLSNLYPPIITGSSTQSAALARELVCLGHEVIFITAHVDKDTPSYESIEGVHVYRLPAFRLPKLGIALNFAWLSITFTPSNQRRINEIITKHQPDVLHLHNHMFDIAFSAVRMSRIFKIPVVLTIHTIIKHGNPLYNLLLYPLDQIMLRYLVINQVDNMILPDLNARRYVIEAFKVAPTYGDVIPYGISLPDKPSDDVAARLLEQYDLVDKRVILSLGHLHEIRNRHDLIRAMPDVLKEHPNTVLLIVGTVATESPKILAKQLGVDQAVIFAGAMPHDQIPAFLSIADLEAHWLNQDEPENTSLGIASLEAMSAGTTILAAANPDTYGKGMLKHDENIIIVEPHQPEELAQVIIDLLEDDTRRNRIGEKARQTIAKYFSWESVCQKTIAVYENVKGR